MTAEHTLISKLNDSGMSYADIEGLVDSSDGADSKLWLLLVEKVTVGTDGKLTFTLRNGMEIEV